MRVRDGVTWQMVQNGVQDKGLDSLDINPSLSWNFSAVKVGTWELLYLSKPVRLGTICAVRLKKKNGSLSFIQPAIVLQSKSK